MTQRGKRWPGYNSPMEPYFFPFRTRVRYAETDQMGVVHHGVYAIWFEAGRTAFSRAVGFPYAEWERLGVLLMVSDLSCRFRKAARYDEEVTVWVRVAEAARRRVVFSYRVTNEAGELLAEGETRHLVVDKATGHPIVLPAEFRDALLRQPQEPVGELGCGRTVFPTDS
jgi:acyl-CoA thioester hydrolase